MRDDYIDIYDDYSVEDFADRRFSRMPPRREPRRASRNERRKSRKRDRWMNDRRYEDDSYYDYDERDLYFYEDLRH